MTEPRDRPDPEPEDVEPEDAPDPDTVGVLTIHAEAEVIPGEPKEDQ